MIDDVRPAEPRQRWRVAYRRDSTTTGLTQRDEHDCWRDAIARSGLPIADPAGARRRQAITFGPPLPLGMTADRELLDVLVTRLLPRADMRERLEACAPAGHSVVDLWDVWLGESSLVAQVAAAEYRVVIEPVDAQRLAGAVRAVLAADALPRTRAKSDRTATYDLRPLLDWIEVVATAAGPALRLRTRFDATHGSGRAEDVMAAVGEALGEALAVRHITRVGLLLADD